MIDRAKYKLKEPKIIPPKPSDTIYKQGNLASPHGWVNPKGEFFPCKYGDHEWVAENTHLNEGEYEKAMCDYTKGDGHWISSHVRLDDEWFVTKDQFRFLNDYMAHHDVRDIGSMYLRIK